MGGGQASSEGRPGRPRRTRRRRGRGRRPGPAPRPTSAPRPVRRAPSGSPRRAPRPARRGRGRRRRGRRGRRGRRARWARASRSRRAGGCAGDRGSARRARRSARRRAPRPSGHRRRSVRAQRPPSEARADAVARAPLPGSPVVTVATAYSSRQRAVTNSSKSSGTALTPPVSPRTLDSVPGSGARPPVVADTCRHWGMDLTGSLRQSVTGAAAPRRGLGALTPGAPRWPTWSPQLREVDYPDEVVRAGHERLRVIGVGGLVAHFRRRRGGPRGPHLVVERAQRPVAAVVRPRRGCRSAGHRARRGQHRLAGDPRTVAGRRRLRPAGAAGAARWSPPTDPGRRRE